MRAVHVAGTSRPGGWRDDALLLALALLARLLHGLALRADPLFDWPQIDARLFWQSAQALAQGQGAEAVFYKPPLLSYLLAGLIALVLAWSWNALRSDRLASAQILFCAAARACAG